MNGGLILRNRQRARPVDMRRLRCIVDNLLREDGFAPVQELAICLVSSREIARLNEQYLNHAGATDVIAFGYSDAEVRGRLWGDIFVCVDQACAQARRFRTTWQDELVRYIVHGVLHLSGYDDLEPVKRRRMKLEENRLLRRLGREHSFARLARRLRRS